MSWKYVRGLVGEHGLAMWCQWNQLCQMPGFQLVKILHCERSFVDNSWWLRWCSPLKDDNELCLLQHWRVKPDEGRNLITFALAQVEIKRYFWVAMMMIGPEDFPNFIFPPEKRRKFLCTSNSTFTSPCLILESSGTLMRERWSTSNWKIFQIFDFQPPNPFSFSSPTCPR